MHERARMLAVMAGSAPDRIPWIPRLLIWHNAHKKAGTLPARYRNMTLRELERDLGCGTAGRDGRIFRTRLSGVEVKQRWLNDLQLLTEYVTPVGSVTTLYRGSTHLRGQDIQDLQVEFMIKRREDFAVVEYIVEHTEYLPCFDEYEAYEREVGDDGYPIVSIGECPFHYFLQVLCGYNDAYYHLNDYTNEVERLLAIMTDKERSEMWPLAAQSPARLLLHGQHFSSEMTPPPLFRAYIEPYYKEFSALLHKHDKRLVHHADNDTRRIFANLERSGYDMMECFATAPMVDTTLAEARAAWGRRLIIWGGVPSVILESYYAEEEFEQYMDGVFRTIAPGDAFILGVSDNVLPGADIERVRRISEMVEERGFLPIKA